MANKGGREKKDNEQVPGSLAKGRLTKKAIEQLTNSLFSTTIDATLYWLLILPVASFGKKGSMMAAFDILEEADYLKEKVSYKQFKNAYLKLKQKGLITSVKEWKNKSIATEKGRKRLRSNLPFYDEKRAWDGNLYLVQYDIPIHQNAVRDQFREWFLKRLGAIKLQDSSYLLFDNPQELIKRFINQIDDFEGNVVISRFSPDGFLGEVDLKEFLWKKAGLSNINDKYKLFLEKYRQKDDSRPKSELFLDYFSILKEDPQLPFKLLPEEYLGDEAYWLFLKRSKSTLFYKYVL